MVGRSILFAVLAGMVMVGGPAQALGLGGVTGAVGGLVGGATGLLEPRPLAAPEPPAPAAPALPLPRVHPEAIGSIEDVPDVPDGDALPAAKLPEPDVSAPVPAPSIPTAPDAPLPRVVPAPALPPARTGQVGLPDLPSTDPRMPDTRGIASGPTMPRPGAPGTGGGGLGTQNLAADMGARKGMGEAFQDWASEVFGGASGLASYFPAEVRAVFTSAWGLLASGLAVVAAYLMGFRYVRSDNLLEHGFRQQLVDLVRANPGMHLREVARRLSLTTTNAAYHLRVLEKHGVLRSEALNGKRVYFPAAGPEAKRRYLAQAMLHRDARADVLRAVAAHPGTNQSRIATMTEQHQGAVGWHLRRLMAAGLLTEERTPRECRYHLTPLGHELSQPHVVFAAVPRAA